MPNKNPHLGRILADRYLLFEELGHGSMGQVYGAKDQKLGGVSVAVKFLSQSLMNERMRDRFKREADICAGLGNRSIHIIQVRDYGIDEHDIPFYVMEYLRGESLNEIIRRQPLPIPRFLSFCRQICLGLQRAHQGVEVDGEVRPIIHRDIKPSNIFITEDDTLGELVKVLDFGIAKTLEDDNESSDKRTKCFMGTLAYSSPEQMEGRDLDHRSDIYSLGIMLFQMLSGKMPLNADTRTFGGWYHAHREKSPRRLNQAKPGIQVPKLLENLVMSCLEKEPENRPQNVSEIIKELAPLSERFGRAADITREWKKRLSQIPVAKLAQAPNVSQEKPEAPLTPERICQLSSWPKEKPIAEIVFPQILATSVQPLATLWAMLPQATIDTLSHAVSHDQFLPHNKFLFTLSPHPTLLWLTVLYTQSSGPKWLPCYLDLKSSEGKKMLKLLEESKQYRILFFAKENPKKCAMVQTLSITEPSPQLQDKQAAKLQEFGVMGSMAPETTSAFSKLSKSLLKEELEKLKPTIAQKLEAIA